MIDRDLAELYGVETRVLNQMEILTPNELVERINRGINTPLLYYICMVLIGSPWRTNCHNIEHIENL